MAFEIVIGILIGFILTCLFSSVLPAGILEVPFVPLLAVGLLFAFLVCKTFNLGFWTAIATVAVFALLSHRIYHWVFRRHHRPSHP